MWHVFVHPYRFQDKCEVFLQNSIQHKKKKTKEIIIIRIYMKKSTLEYMSSGWGIEINLFCILLPEWNVCLQNTQGLNTNMAKWHIERFHLIPKCYVVIHSFFFTASFIFIEIFMTISSQKGRKKILSMHKIIIICISSVNV